MNSTGRKNLAQHLFDTGRRFGSDTSGVFAVTFAIMAIVLIALAGATVDYTMWMAARTAAQHAADSGALAAVVSNETQSSKLKSIASGFADSQLVRWPHIELDEVTYSADTDQVEVVITGHVETYFVSLVGVTTLPVYVSSVAERSSGGRLELAMVLDNTYSMASSDGAGSTKIAALKAATHSLLDEVLGTKNNKVTVGIVPYAEYVNVGLLNRTQPWMKVPANYTECFRIFGICFGSKTEYKWFGCALSRNVGDLRLSTEQPYTQYGGQMDSSQKCMTPIVPLTDQEQVIRNAVNGMVVNIGDYKPSTYIPAGLVWGINVLTPPAPFEQGEATDPQNMDPRKVMILMTDGENNLRYNPADGSHVSANQEQVRQTDRDTGSLCQNAKAIGIEIFTVSFGKLSSEADTMLKNCATSGQHYYAAINAGDLRVAFGRISKMLTDVRLTR